MDIWQRFSTLVTVLMGTIDAHSTPRVGRDVANLEQDRSFSLLELGLLELGPATSSKQVP